MKTSRKSITLSAGIAVLALAGLAPAPPSVATSRSTGGPRFSRPTAITNPFLPISRHPDCELVGVGGGKGTRVVRHVLARREPFTIDGSTVETTVVKDVETHRGHPVEHSLDYLAQDDAGTVYYLGEDVDTYKHGEVVAHEGQWRYGRDTQSLTTLMPAHPAIGDTWVSEDVPGLTHEADKAVRSPKRARVQGRTYDHLLRVRESSLPDRETEFKLYAKGTGVISEENGDLELKAC